MPAFEGLNITNTARRKRMRQRDAFIMVLHRQGYADRAIGERVGVCTTRVEQIRKRQGQIESWRAMNGWPETAAALAAVELNIIDTMGSKEQWQRELESPRNSSQLALKLWKSARSI